MSPLLLPAAALTLTLVASTPASSPAPATQAASGPRRLARTEVPAALEAEVAAAEKTMDALQQRLAQRLMEEVGRGGAVAAVNVCRDEAQKLTVEVAREKGMKLGRTSHRLRNPANAAPEWLRGVVAESAGIKVAGAKPLVFELDGRLGVARPLGVQSLCASCHGDSKGFSPELATALATAYPQDRATGFVEGDLRGWIWVETAAAPGK